jgi:SAM-dependent methyltransferase
MDATKLADYSNPDSFGSRMRARRLEPLKQLIIDIHNKKSQVKILDVGGRAMYWKAFPQDFFEKYRVKITILNLPSDLAREDCGTFSYAVGDACNMSEYADNSFDIAHSNSVIEHVGNWNQIKAFAGEVRRVAPSIFIQTPYYWFPVEPHFIKLFHHWLPKPWRALIWRRFNMGQRGRALNIDEAMIKIDDEPYLLDLEMFRFLFPDCRILKERLLFLTKSMVAFRA